MSVAKLQDDPRDAALETKFTLPNSWYRDSGMYVLGSSTMFFAGLILVTRNRFLAWPTVIFAINGLINQHPLRSKDGQGGGWNNVFLCVTALFAAYFPLFLMPTPVNCIAKT
ncbi:hypothetical protein F5887DRAFT_874026 [Amanita rubescens]|nr:hypothetical protein F5887DRAFT_874026 [Amanita rubescens]